MLPKNHVIRLYPILTLSLVCLLVPSGLRAQPDLRHKLGQMVMVTVTGDSAENVNMSMDTLKSDLANGLVGGLVMYAWSGNLNNPSQIAHLTSELQQRSAIPLLLAIDEEGGVVARLGLSNGFAATPSAYQMGTVINLESYTRHVGETMAGWFVQTGLNLDLAPVVDVDVNPTSPAIGALGRSFSKNPDSVALHAGWFIDEFHKQSVHTTLKHFPGHGSATTDSHLGFTDVTATWSSVELVPYSQLLQQNVVDVVMTAHVFNKTIDSLYPATLSYPTITGLLRNQLGYHGVVISDDMYMKAISDMYGLDQAMELAVKAGVDVLLYTSNIDSAGHSLAARVVNVLEQCVQSGTISQARIDSSYARIMALKSRLVAGILPRDGLPTSIALMNYPNPFNPGTTIQYELPSGAYVTLTISNILGQQVATLVNEYEPAGVHMVRFDASRPAGGSSHLASGVYLYRLQARNVATTRRMMLLR